MTSEGLEVLILSFPREENREESRPGPAPQNKNDKVQVFLGRERQNVTDKLDTLLDASKSGELASLEKILSQDREFESTFGHQALTMAVYHNQVEAVRLLLARGIDPNKYQHGKAGPAILVAAERGHLEAASILIEGGAHLSPAGFRSRTPLHEAAQKGHLEMVSLLLPERAPLNAQDFSACTPLMHAARNCHEEVIKALLEAGADSSRESRNGKTAHSLAETSCGKETLKLFD